MKSIEEIRKNAPDGATRYYLFPDGDVFYYKGFYSYFMQWIAGHGWFPCEGYLFEDTKPL